MGEFNRIAKTIKPVYERERLKRAKDDAGRISDIKTLEDKLTRAMDVAQPMNF
jgi:hypothetical protein